MYAPKKIRNPQTGIYVKVDGPKYKELVSKGIIDEKASKGEVLPPICHYVYIPANDIWVKIGGYQYNVYIERGYIHTKNGMLVEKTIYMESISNTPVLDTIVWEQLYKYMDGLSIIVRYALWAKMYSRLRLVSKRMLALVDSVCNNAFVHYVIRDSRELKLNIYTPVYVINIINDIDRWYLITNITQKCYRYWIRKCYPNKLRELFIMYLNCTTVHKRDLVVVTLARMCGCSIRKTNNGVIVSNPKTYREATIIRGTYTPMLVYVLYGI